MGNLQIDDGLYWHQSNDIFQMWNLVEHRISDRKKWLLACALCRSIPGYMDSPKDYIVLHAAERHIDGFDTLQIMLDHFGGTNWDIRFHRLDATEVINRVIESIWSEHEKNESAWDDYAEILRDIVGDPFQPMHSTTSISTPRAIQLANQIYASNRFEAVVDLIQELEKSGSDMTHAREHLRQSSLYVKGCWAIDTIMGYSQWLF